MSFVMRNDCVSVVVLSSSSIVPSLALLALKRSHFAWAATRRPSPTTRANAKHRLMCLASTTRLDLIRWTWTIPSLIFTCTKLLIEAFYVYVYVYVCVYVSLWFSEPYRSMVPGDLPREFLVFAFSPICQ